VPAKVVGTPERGYRVRQTVIARLILQLSGVRRKK
jgi:hypothetical protein